MFFARSLSLRVRSNDAERLDRDRRQGDGVHVVALQRPVLERVGRVADLREVALGELVGVGDDRRAAGHVGEVRLEGRGVHRDEHVGLVARSEHVVVGEVELEARDAGQGALRCADLGGEVRQRGQVVAEEGGLGGEPVAGELHPVTGVAREADDDTVEADRLRGCSVGRAVRLAVRAVRRAVGCCGCRGGHAWDHQNSLRHRNPATSSWPFLQHRMSPVAPHVGGFTNVTSS